MHGRTCTVPNFLRPSHFVQTTSEEHCNGNVSCFHRTYRPVCVPILDHSGSHKKLQTKTTSAPSSKICAVGRPISMIWSRHYELQSVKIGPTSTSFLWRWDPSSPFGLKKPTPGSTYTTSGSETVGPYGNLPVLLAAELPFFTSTPSRPGEHVGLSRNHADDRDDSYC